MARKATAKNRGRGKTSRTGTSVARISSGGKSERSGSQSSETMGETFIKLLQSPLVAELVAVAATAALAALAEQGFTGNGASRGKRAGKVVKAAGKAAATAVGRRLANEIDAIKSAAEAAKSAAKA